MTDVVDGFRVPVGGAVTASSELADSESTAANVDLANAEPISETLVERTWHGSYRALLIVSDVTGILLALAIAFVTRFKITDVPAQFSPALLLVVGVAVAWIASLVVCDAYEVRRVCSGPEEWQRLVRASALAFGLVVIGCYFLKQDVARGFLLIVFPVGVVLLAVGRLNVRRIVRSRRASAEWHHRILAVGSSASINHLIHTSHRAAHSGVLVIGACVDDAEIGAQIGGGVSVVGRVNQASRQAEFLGADLVALAGSDLGPVGIRELGWELEGSGRGLVMAHAVSDVAAPRIHVSPLEGMPMVWVDQPQFSGLARRLKRLFDLGAAALGLLALSPLLAAVALAVKVTSTGPVCFKQSRLGLDGQEFDVLKFRTMVANAHELRADLIADNQMDGALFKMASDPRITPLGKWLRRLSIDELPQLWNVIRGDMSLVGPRPLATQDSDYDGHARRRLLVRPGITGLWQVSGRSDVSWEDAVKLDLYYVENWSLGFDLSLIFKTIAAVLLRRGAY